MKDSELKQELGIVSATVTIIELVVLFQDKPQSSSLAMAFAAAACGMVAAAATVVAARQRETRRMDVEGP